MAVKVFVSAGAPADDSQRAFRDTIVNAIEIAGLSPRLMTDRDWDYKNPLRGVRRAMEECSGAVVVAYPRYRFPSGEELRKDGVRSLQKVSFPTAWNQIEAAMAYERGFPLLIIAQTGLRQDAFLETTNDVRPFWADPDTAVSHSEGFLGYLQSWKHTTRSFAWTPGAAGTYSVKGEVGVVSGETDTSDNSKTINVNATTAPVHDMAVTDVYISPGSPNVGQSTTIYVTVKNEGNQQENSVPVKAYVNGAQVGSTQNVSLSADQNTTRSFAWTPGAEGTYSVKGEVGVVSGETDTGDNSKTINVETATIVITGINPSQPIACSGKQWLAIIGNGFTSNSKVTLSVDSSTYLVPEDRTWLIDSNKIEVLVGLTKGTWKVWVTNPDDIKSNTFIFQVRDFSIEDGKKVAALALQYWDDEEDVITMVAIAVAESCWNPNAAGDPQVESSFKCGGHASWGLWQINMAYHHDKSTFKNLGISQYNPCETAKWLLNPENNAKAAYEVWKDSGFKPWSTYGDGKGKYTYYWDVAREAVESLAHYAHPPIADAFQYPLKGYTPNENFFGQNDPIKGYPQRYHLGEDIGKPAGTPVYACANGIVKIANNRHSGEGNYGGLIIIEHTLPNSDKICSLYGHLDDSKTLVRPDDVVERGQQIGEIGKKDPNINGNHTPHLHFGVRFGAFPGEEAPDPNTTSGKWLGGYGKINPITINNWWIKPSDFIKDHAQSWIEVSAHSPVELRVYDSLGRVTGVVNGEIRGEIPNSACHENTVTILYPSDSYSYEVVGTGEGSYGLTVTRVAEQTTDFSVTNVPTSANTVHQYTIDWDALTEEGVTLRIYTDGDSESEETRILRPPMASFVYSPSAVAVNEETRFDASQSYDTDGEIVQYQWHFGDGNTASGQVVSHTYSAAENYTVTLTVTDNDGASSTYSTVIQAAEKGQGLPAWAWVLVGLVVALAIAFSMLSEGIRRQPQA